MSANYVAMDIASLLEVQVTEEQQMSVSSNKAPNSASSIITNLKPAQIVTPEEKQFYKFLFGNDIAKVRFRRLHCSACDIHIGSAPSQAYNMHEHPILKTLLCAGCRQFYGDGTFEQGDDATDMFCRWCANGGNLYCCSYCSNTFCSKCIKRNFDPDVGKKIEDDEKWKCFVCDPKDLFTARAVCWAILQHIKTLSRILQVDRAMTPKEVQSKMDQDDSQCCSGRRPKPAKRKSRGESSSDESSTSSTKNSSKSGSTPHLNRSKKTKKWKRRKSVSKDTSVIGDHHYISNGRLLPNHSRFMPYGNQESSSKTEEDDIGPLLHCEQTMIEGDNDSVILPSSGISKTSISKTPVSPHIDGASSLHAIPTQNLMNQSICRRGKTLIPIRPLRKIDSLPPGANPQIITRLPHFPVLSQRTPMVTLPTRSHINADFGSGQPSQQRLKKYPNIQIDRNKINMQPIVAPSIINLESDTEESPNHADKSDDEGIIELDSFEPVTQSENLEPANNLPRLTVKNFEQNMKNPMKSIDILLKKLRRRLKIEMNTFEGQSEGNDIHVARMKLKIINKNIEKVVTELSALNNRMIRQYKPWKKSQITGETLKDSTTRIILGKKDQGTLSLDMECVADSDSDIGGDEDNLSEENCLVDFSRKLTIFTEKETKDQECNTKIETEDKGVQVYETFSTDYDMSIGYSLLMRADYDYEKKKEIFKPVVIHDEFFGKYEEQFIFYLQSCEDSQQSPEEEKENTSPKRIDDRTLKDLIDADLSAKCLEDDGKQETLKESISVVANESGSSSSSSDLSSLGGKTITLDTSKESNKMTSIESEDDNDDKIGTREKEDGEKNTEKTTNNIKESEIEVRTELDEISIPDTRSQSPNRTSTPSKNSESIENGSIANANSSPSKHEETATAVRALIKDTAIDQEFDESPKKQWKDNEDDDECTIID